MLSYITAVMVSIFVAWFTGYIRIDGTLDTDGWFLLATGREIVHNGIPFENPWSLDPGQGIIVQQWLHDVWLYGWYSLAGYTGVATSVVVPLAIAAIAYYFLIERLTRGCRHQGITWLLYAVGFFHMFTYISIRPTLWSAGCLFVTLNILFAWHEDGNVRALWLLPAVTLLQVNLQAALWPLCLAACLSFLLPEIGELHIKTFKTDMVAWYTYRIPLLRACLLMCIASLSIPTDSAGRSTQCSLWEPRPTAMSLARCDHLSLVRMIPMPSSVRLCVSSFPSLSQLLKEKFRVPACSHFGLRRW